MRLLHYIEIENFKRFGSRQRIELEHPAVLIGPNNCGKTSAIQALALWSQAVKTWCDVRKDSAAKERTATGLNRLNIVAVPVQRTRFFWHNTKVQNIPLTLTVGVSFKGSVVPLTMKFTYRGDEVVYCSPDEPGMKNTELVRYAAGINVELLYPMSGLETEEPILQPGRIDVLLGQGQTAQVLRNLCLMVLKNSNEDWARIVQLMRRLFNVELKDPQETARGAIEMRYKQPGVREALDVSSSGRGFQQMLLIFAYLYSHKRSVLMVDEPDAHLEILRQKQVYVLLRDIASENESQVVMVTHSEVILDEALETNLTLLLEGHADNLAERKEIKNSLKHFGAEHYVKARERGYVLYVEGGTDVDMLRALASKLDHPVARMWDERINSYYVQNNYPGKTLEAELEAVEGGFGRTPREHFNGLRDLLPSLKGLAILDNDGRGRMDVKEGALSILYWRRYEAENYFVTPEVLKRYAMSQSADMELFGSFESDIDEVLDALVLRVVFDSVEADFRTWKNSSPEAARIIWEAKTERRKLSAFAEEFFQQLSGRIGGPVLLRKGELHRLVEWIPTSAIAAEVSQKLDALQQLFAQALPPEAVEVDES
ncbi:AAA family ATPase [Paracidovorax avenae]|uniref:AAA family ATPase n=1 Tax=Paracidovorax avenae TaxID=80867 RepID=UPI000D17B53C|nr:ATP-binding protein [Paracidovorax avenae]AVS82261.1 AAA family ATPase [Paracidovorax avenae]AVT17441.1 AAA family ATPase [Paracidovorax avenae]